LTAAWVHRFADSDAFVLSSAWSPDGKEIAFTAEMINHETAWSTGWRIFTVAIGQHGPETGSLRYVRRPPTLLFNTL
jgi:hypothetical protein